VLLALVPVCDTHCACMLVRHECTEGRAADSCIAGPLRRAPKLRRAMELAASFLRGWAPTASFVAIGAELSRMGVALQRRKRLKAVCAASRLK
jgi:hypothetical protein